MNILLALLILYCGTGVDYQTKEMTDTIAMLGNDSFEKREEAQKKLLSMKEIPILALERKFSTEPDPEIRFRLNSVIKARTFYDYTKVIGEKGYLPSIFHLDPAIRFPFGYSYKEVVLYEYDEVVFEIFGWEFTEKKQIKDDVVTSYLDISKMYYDRAVKYMNRYERVAEEGKYNDWEVQQVATKLFLRDLMRSSILSKEELDELLKYMMNRYNPRPSNGRYEEYDKHPPSPAIIKDGDTPQVEEEP